MTARFWRGKLYIKCGAYIVFGPSKLIDEYKAEFEYWDRLEDRLKAEEKAREFKGIHDAIKKVNLFSGYLLADFLSTFRILEDLARFNKQNDRKISMMCIFAIWMSGLDYKRFCSCNSNYFCNKCWSFAFEFNVFAQFIGY